MRAGRTGMGFATAAAARLTDDAFALPGVERVEIRHDRANVASSRVPQKLGYEPAGELRVERDTPAATGVRLVWRMTRPRWRARGRGAPPLIH